ncbi:phage tail tape measure protein [Pedobacter ureilyticus]|uniref:Phage tail tape measure protein n=1 Tax=Pedobacter ureilyticus TaxID=1393051 RepID=A0ABW9J1V9_9SPHI|nr:phage tail tape measure protein [Pedobacter helvus]
MAATVKVPTIFSAVDKVSTIVKRMSRNVRSFASTVSSGIAKSNRWFKKLTPSISEAGNELLSYAKSAAIAGGIIAGISFSANAVTDYEQNVASFRTIVSDLSSKDFSVYKKEVGDVATATKASTIEVVQSFEKIAGLNAKFAETSTGIGQVSKAAITLAKASGDELGTSAENLVGIMNQFSLGADQANRTINVLAAGQAVGAASISQTSEAFKNFGSVASGANMSLEQSVGLIQTLGKFSIFGAEAGTKLRGVTLKLQQAGAGYASGQFQINDALAQVSKKYNKLTSQRAKDAFMLKLFGAENISVGKTLLSNIALFKEYTDGVSGTTEAQKAAAINSDTVNKKLEEMKNKWVNIITTSDQAESSLTNAKTAMGYVTDNMEAIISIGSKILLFFAAWKAIIIANSIAMGAYNIALGINGAVTGIVSIAVGKSNIALKAYQITTKAVTAAQWLWNVAMTANPIGLIIVGIAALIAIVVVVIQKWDEWGAAFSLVMGPLGIVISLIQSFRRNWDMITKAFKEGGILEGLKAIGKVILDALLQPFEQLLGIIAKVTGFKWAENAAAGLNKFRAEMGVSMEAKPALGTPQQKAEELKSQNPQTNTLDVNFNDPDNRVKSTSMKGPLAIPVKVTSTNGKR